MGKPNAMELTARRIESGEYTGDDLVAIMGLLGFEVRPHRRTRYACRPIGEGGHFQSLPHLRSAHDAELWLRPERTGGRFDDMGQDEDGTWYASFLSKTFGNDYGNSGTLGLAMFAAFARSEGQADDGDD
jgi:hypothetical protein